MPYEKSAGAVIFKVEKGEPKYLLLQHPSMRSGQAAADYWNSPKGLIEKGEDEREAAVREIKEETGLSDIEFIEGFRERDHYLFRRKSEKPGHKAGFTIKDVFFYLARAKDDAVKISWEHQGYEWLPYEEAMKRLKYPGIKRVLQRAHEFLKSKRVAL